MATKKKEIIKEVDLSTPHNKEAEQEILGLIFLDDNRIKYLVDELKITDFYIQQHQKIYTAMLYLYHITSPITYNTVLDRLTKKGEDVPVDYLLSLTDCVMKDEDIYIDKNLVLLKDLSFKRELYEMGKYLTNEEIKGISSENLVSKVNSVLDNVKVTSNIEASDFAEYTDEWLKEFETPLDESNKLLFGFRKLDDIVMIEKGNLITVAGLAGQGKSAVALNFARNFCYQKRKVVFISLEMSKKEVMDRMVANISQVELDKVKRKTANKEEREKIKEALKEIKEFDWIIFDGGSMDIEHLRNYCKKLKKEGKLDVLLVDYVGLLNAGKGLSTVQEVSMITRGLKQLAQELKIPIIQLAQLNRQVTGRDGKIREPQLADLKSSSSIEQDSNVVIFVHPRDPDAEYNKYVKFIVRKNRSGTTGTIDLEYIGDNMKYIEKEYDTEMKKWVEVEQIDFRNKNVNTNFITDDDLPF